MRKNVTINWTVKESVQANLRRLVRLRRLCRLDHGPAFGTGARDVARQVVPAPLAVAGSDAPAVTPEEKGGGGRDEQEGNAPLVTPLPPTLR